MEWWNEIQAWFISTSGSKIFLDAILPFVAIVLAGLIAAAIGRGSTQRVIAHSDREHTAAAVVALIIVGRKAAIWTSLGADEKQHIDSLMSEADIRVRLLPMNGSSIAADWAAHELAFMKKNSATFSFQAEQSFIDYRDRLLNWQVKPRRARKLFSSDLEQWRYEDADAASAVVAQQQAWAADHVEPTPTAPAPAPAPTPTLAVPVRVTPNLWKSHSPHPVPAASAPVTASTAVIPELANAAPPTVAPMDAPAPVSAVSPAK